MGQFETTLVVVLVPCNPTTVVDWGSHGSHTAVDITVRISCPYAQCSSSEGLCSHISCNVQHVQRFGRYTSCKSFAQAYEPQPQEIVPWPCDQLPLFNRNHRNRDNRMAWFKHLREYRTSCASCVSLEFITMRMRSC